MSPSKPQPGTELAKLIPSWLKREGCGCKSFAAKMNRWGVDGCRQRREEILDHLESQARQFTWTIVVGIAIRPTLGVLLDRALATADRIRRNLEIPQRSQ